MLRFVLAGPKGAGKSSIFSRLSPQASGSTKSGTIQTTPIPPALFSVVTLDFPSSTFSSITQRDAIPQVILNAHAIIYVTKESNVENLKQLNSLLSNCDLTPKLFFLLHQIDRIDKDEQTKLINQSHELAKQEGICEENCFATSLFDGSLTYAFSSIISHMLPQYEKLNIAIKNLAKSLKADRILICDAATFLPVCSSNPDKLDLPQPIFDFFLRVYPKKNPLVTLTFECNNSVVVFTTISDTTGIFICSTNTSITTDAIMFNIQRALPTLKELVKIEF